MDHGQGVVRLLVRCFRGWLIARDGELRATIQVGRHPTGPATQPQVTPDAFKVRHFSPMLQCSITDKCDPRLTKVSPASPPPTKRAIPSARNDALVPLGLENGPATLLSEASSLAAAQRAAPPPGCAQR
jgi:hypothetical protein